MDACNVVKRVHGGAQICEDLFKHLLFCNCHLFHQIVHICMLTSATNRTNSKLLWSTNLLQRIKFCICFNVVCRRYCVNASFAAVQSGRLGWRLCTAWREEAVLHHPHLIHWFYYLFPKLVGRNRWRKGSYLFQAVPQCVWLRTCTSVHCMAVSTTYSTNARVKWRGRMESSWLTSYAWRTCLSFYTAHSLPPFAYTKV